MGMGFNLLQIRAPIRRKHEGDVEMFIACIPPWAAHSLNTIFKANSTSVALRLVDLGGDVLVASLRLNKRDAFCPGEQRIVGWSTLCGPFCNGHIAAFDRTATRAV